MGKKAGGSSWLTAVKRAFRSPSKDSDRKSSRQRLEFDQEEDDKVRSLSLPLSFSSTHSLSLSFYLSNG